MARTMTAPNKSSMAYTVSESIFDIPSDVAEKAVATLVAAARRAMDIFISLLLLILAAPLLFGVVLLIKADSRGPVLYRQERLGLNGRRFIMLKMRTMRTDAEAIGPQWAAIRDPRITHVGRWLRLTHIDELPQLLNVLGGTMSVIGPRPERPHFVDELARVVPRYDERLSVKPGITGWAQINCPYGASIDDARNKLSFDLYYLEHRSAGLDLRILLETVRVVLTLDGAR
jgi:lipopolysaccharide/colanic/teichoic acid biosynthesis glycosyltransferase